MDWRFSTPHAGQQFIRASGDDLIDVHIGLRARARLPDDERELIVELARDDFRRGRFDRGGDLGFETVRAVHPRGGLLHERERIDDAHRHAFLRAEGKILDRALGLGAPIGGGRNFDGAERIAFGAGFHGWGFRCFLRPLLPCVIPAKAGTHGLTLVRNAAGAYAAPARHGSPLSRG